MPELQADQVLRGEVEADTCNLRPSFGCRYLHLDPNPRVTEAAELRDAGLG